jgi:hypothetical protein
MWGWVALMIKDDGGRPRTSSEHLAAITLHTFQSKSGRAGKYDSELSKLTSLSATDTQVI